MYYQTDRFWGSKDARARFLSSHLQAGKAVLHGTGGVWEVGGRMRYIYGLLMFTASVRPVSKSAQEGYLSRGGQNSQKCKSSYVEVDLRFHIYELPSLVKELIERCWAQDPTV